MIDKPEEKQSLYTFRNIGKMAGQMVIAVILPLIVYVKDENCKNIMSGNRAMISELICGVLAFSVYYACYYFSTGRIKLIKFYIYFVSLCVFMYVFYLDIRVLK